MRLLGGEAPGDRAAPVVRDHGFDLAAELAISAAMSATRCLAR